MTISAVRSRLSPIWPSLPVALLFAGAVIRIAGIGAGAIWYDEAYSLTLTRFDPITMARLAALDFNPPLNELILWPIVRLLGEIEIALRLPALIASLVSLWLAWRLCDELYIVRPTQRIASMALVALLPVGFWTAQDGRVYALLTAFYLGQLYAARRRNWIAVTICTIGLLYGHTTGVFYALSGLLAALLMTSSNRVRRSLLIAGGVGGLAYLPYLPVLLHTTGNDFWLEPLSTGNWSYSLVQAFYVGTITDQRMIGLAVIVLKLSLILAAVFTILPAVSATVPGWMLRVGQSIINQTGATAKLAVRDPIVKTDYRICNDRNDGDGRYLPLGVFALGPICLMVLVSLLYKNVVFYRPLTVAVIPMALWFAAVLTPRRLTITTWVLPYSWIVLIVAGLVTWSPMLKGGNLRAVADLVNAQVQPGDVIYHATATSYLPASFYLSDPGYLLDEEQPDGLLQGHLQEAFGIPRTALENIEHERAWIFWARDPLMTDRAVARMQKHTSGARLVAVIDYWQAAPIEVWLSD